MPNSTLSKVLFQHVTHGVDLSYVEDVGGPRKNMKNRQAGPLKCEEAPRKYLLDSKVMKE